MSLVPWSMADLVAAEHELVPQDWQMAAGARRSQSRLMFEDATNYAGAGGSAVQAWSDPSYRSGLPAASSGVDLWSPGAAPAASPAADIVMNQVAADAFVSQPSQAAGMSMLRWLRLLFHNLLQLLLRRGRTAGRAASADDVVSPTVEELILDDLPATTESELLHAARIFAENGQVLSTPIPTSPVAVPRRRR